jgi:plastocyanin
MWRRTVWCLLTTCDTYVTARSTYMSKPKLRTTLAAIVGVVALFAAGCGDDDSDDATDEVDEVADDTGAAGADAGDTIVVRGVDYAFEDLPETVGTGTRVSFVNESEDEVHELVAVRILDDVDLSVEELVELPEEEVDQYLEPGPPAMVLVAAPGEEGFAVVGDGTFSEPGRYAVVCFIPTGADPDEFMAAGEEGDGPPDVEGGPPHVVHGMFAEVTVE